MGRQITIEVCLDSLQSARAAQKVAAEFEGRVKWRIELCSNLIHGGGMTPSIGLIRAIKKLLPNIEIMAMIRPRIGNFTYSEDEIIVMENDILSIKEEGVTGFVFGCLTPGREIDFTSMIKLCKAAAGLPVTFHRAFDLAKGCYGAVPRLKDDPGTSNVTRILTSGGSNYALYGVDCIQALMHSYTSPGFTILPGAGINADSLKTLLWQLPNLSEIHLTGSSAVAVDEVKTGMCGTLESSMKTKGFGVNEIWTMDEGKLRAVFEVIDTEGQMDGIDPYSWMPKPSSIPKGDSEDIETDEEDKESDEET